jgi:hypothetical protein
LYYFRAFCHHLSTNDPDDREEAVEMEAEALSPVLVNRRLDPGDLGAWWLAADIVEEEGDQGTAERLRTLGAFLAWHDWDHRTTRR